MHSSAPGYSRDLDELRQLAGMLFNALRDEYTVDSGISIRFDRIDGLAELTIDQEHLVATTLLCAQLLHRVTADPDRAEPRHVVTLGDIIDQTLTSLLQERRVNTRVSVVLRDVHNRICTICMSLALMADPGASGFSDRRA